MKNIDTIPNGFVGLYFRDNDKKTLSRFALADNLPGMLDILQIVLDTCVNALADVVILDPLRPDKYAEAALVAAHYNMRKRNFNERMNNTKTYNLEV